MMIEMAQWTMERMTFLSQTSANSTSEKTFQLLDMPPAWVVGLVIVPLVLLFSFLVYRRDAARASLGTRLALTGLRSSAILFLFLVFFRPVAVTITYDEFRPVAAVLIDDSASMQRAEEYGHRATGSELATAAGLATDSGLANVTRQELVQRVVERSGLIEELSDKFKVELFAFNDGIRPIENLDALSSTGQYTKVGESLDEALDEFRLQDAWSVIMVTDGRNNGGRDPIDIAKTAAYDDVKVYTVGVGDPAERNDVALRDLKAPDVALIGDEVAFELTVWSRGFDDQPARITLTDKDSGIELESTDFTLKGGQEQRETLYFRPERDGEFVVQVSIPVLPGELTPENNSREHTLRVDPELIKVMYIEGYPRWEYRYLKNTLLRAENMRAQCLLLSASKDFIQESSDGVPALIGFPDRKSLFEYDVLILGDVPPYALADRSEDAEAILKNIKDFVSLGGGLLMVAGEIDNPWSYSGTPVEDLLPIEIGERGEERSRVDDSPFRPKLEDPFRPHEVVRLEKDLELNHKLWEDADFGLAPLWWYAPVKRAKPGAEVLLRHPSNANRYGNHVIAATTFYPSGRTMFLGIDNTWRWRKPYDNRYTERFWRGIVRYLALNKLRRTDKRFELSTDQALYDINERIVIRARIRDEDFRLATEEEQVIKFQPPEADEESLVLRKVEDGTYERAIHASIPGTYRIWAEDPSSTTAEKLSLTPFDVQVPRRELENDQLDEALLTEMAQLTGGEYLRLHDVAELKDRLEGEPIRLKTGQQEEDIWDSFEWLLILMALLGGEWILRKRLNMI